MSIVIKILLYLGLALLLSFILSLIGFYFYRNKNLDKVNIIKYVSKSKDAFSTYNIHKSLFPNKKVSYVIELLAELQEEKVIKRIEIGSSKENSLWEKI